MNWILTYLTELVTLTLEMAPYLLLGFLIAGILRQWMPPGMMKRWMGKNDLRSVLNAALLGIPLPLCSCGVIPTGISLYKEGASKGASISFLISTPQTGVDSIAVTYSMMGLPFALIRPVIALFTGVAGGWMTRFIDSNQEANAHSLDQQNTIPSSSQSFTDKLKRVFSYAFDEFLDDLAKWLIIGLLLAALIAVLIPDDFFRQSFFSNEAISMLVILVASIPFYVCATGSVPIAAVLLMKGLSPGAVLVFLMAGPATNIATITVIAQTMGRKTMMLYLAALSIGALVFGMIINTVLPRDWFLLSGVDEHVHGGSWMFWVEAVSACLFIVILTRIYVMKWIRKNRTKEQLVSDDAEEVTIGVEGMTCDNCRTKVENGLLDLESVQSTAGDVAQKTVVLKGSKINLEAVERSLTDLGYHYTGIVHESN